ncbi:Retrovirus-related Pol polyprotein from transposon TNT 1-94 [Cucumis melo var. makuwa]|uniref:Retrovirus-related Pol polyprotein from transposon TNT 1-94 n=1 Tax=Cucumis melo var. makuwa TaxID=1194695 RepID=A0A5A7V6Z9_CUCMM|nr:Retrovirus-related Pol polyprotein from transposon TNT 1-94 [Cucumis melo var. makuwa]
MTHEEKETMENAPYGAIVLNLSDNVLREVISEQTTYGMWKKLEELYQSKDLPNRAYVRERFFTFKMDGNKSLTENLGEFKKLSSDFRELGDKIGIGSVTLKFKDGIATLLRNVRYVPSLKRNLISLGMLDFIGCEYRGSA